jgi:hypothetical protein
MGKRVRPTSAPSHYGAILVTVFAGWLVICCGADLAAQSVARQWNEELLAAIRKDFPAPTVHARNLFHASVAMYDAWAAYDCRAVGYLHNEEAIAMDLAAARNEAVSYAAYRVLTARYALAVDPTNTLPAFHARMAALGYDANIATTLGTSPAAVGNRCAGAVLSHGASDGANEASGYADTTGYTPTNKPLLIALSGTQLLNGTGRLNDPSRWQPLAFDLRVTQNGLIVDEVQEFVGPHWGYVAPFALSGAWSSGVYQDCDPGSPPQLSSPSGEAFKQTFLTNIYLSSQLDPGNGFRLDISPASLGNNPLGTYDGTGYPVNPATGRAYASNVVRHADYGRVIAEYWADGPESETPPGHWNLLANHVGNHSLFQRRFRGEGPVLDSLEWDVKLYFALNGALHDAAVAAWGLKSHYDFVRPITAIRHMGGMGQSSDPLGPSYHPDGLPLVPGLVEVITAGSSAAGERHAHLARYRGRIAIYAWPGEPEDQDTQAGGAEWIVAQSWLPYQRDTFVTPAFAGYISGHSTFNRAAAEVLTLFTGDAYFPGGLAMHTVPRGALEFEYGPTEDIQLQWARYYDAADEAGLSRLYGGIHPTVDDLPGRVIGSWIGKAAFAMASTYFNGSILPDEPCSPERLIRRLISRVEQSGLPRKPALLASLEAASASIQRGNPNSASGQLAAFLNKTGAQVTGKEAPLTVQLIEDAREILAALEPEKLPHPVGRIHSLTRRPDGEVQMTIRGEPGRSYVLDGSTNLVDWRPICVVRPDTRGSCTYRDREASKSPSRFYRLRQP